MEGGEDSSSTRLAVAAAAAAAAASHFDMASLVLAFGDSVLLQQAADSHLISLLQVYAASSCNQLSDFRAAATSTIA